MRNRNESLESHISFILFVLRSYWQELELDKETIMAGLLHDVVEDTETTHEDIVRDFGEEVAQLVDGVTKLGQLSYSKDKIEVQAENLRKMFLAMAKISE